MQIEYVALNGAEYLAVRKCEKKLRYLIRDSKLASVWTNCEESELNPPPLVRMNLTRFEI